MRNFNYENFSLNFALFAFYKFYKFLFGSLEVRGNLSINGTINNHSIPHDFMKTFGEQIVKGKKTFTSRTTFLQHVNTSGFVDGVNISEVHRRSISLTDDQIIQHKIYFKSTTFAGESISLVRVRVSAQRAATPSLKWQL